jgi:hypothetical protein
LEVTTSPTVDCKVSFPRVHIQLVVILYMSVDFVNVPEESKVTGWSIAVPSL